MRAVVLRRHGRPGELALEELPTPRPGIGEVLIEVHAIGVNYPDLLVIDGEYQNLPPLPFSPGKDVAGIVAAVGPGVVTCKPGDRVLAALEHGGYAEQALALAANCHGLPEGMGFTAAAAMGLVYQTAHFALLDRGLYRTGETVLVTGAGGGVGLAGVQLAKAWGATVLAGVRGGAQAALARADGADHIVDLAVPDLREGVRRQVREATGGYGADVILDPLGGEVFEAALRALAWRGRLVVIGFAAGRIPSVKTNYLLVKNITVCGLQWSDYRERDPTWVRRVQDELFALHGAGKIAPRIMAEHPLEEVAAALDRLRRGGVQGKVVMTTRHGR